jgi:tight adherence protein C
VTASSLRPRRRSLGAAPREPRAWRSAAAVAVAVVGLTFGVWGVVAGAALVATASSAVRSRRHRRQRELVAAMAEAVPLLQLAVQAGLTVRASLAVTVPWLHGELAEGLRGAVAQSDAGVPMADALDVLGSRLGPAVLPLTTVLASADRYGAPVAGPLERLGAELRLQRRRQLEAAARRLPVKLLFPLVVGVLPAFVCLAVVPLVAASLQGVSIDGG